MDYPDYPKTLSDFESAFDTDEKCLKYFQQTRWGDTFRCEQCGNDTAWKTKDNRYICKQYCHSNSAISRTIFQNTRKPMTQRFRAIWLLTSSKTGVSANQMMRVLDIKSYTKNIH